MRFGPCLSKETEKILITAYSISVFWDKKGRLDSVGSNFSWQQSQFGSCLSSDEVDSDFFKWIDKLYQIIQIQESSDLIRKLLSNHKASIKAKTDICEKIVCKEKPCDCDQLRHTHQKKQGLNSIIWKVGLIFSL